MKIIDLLNKIANGEEVPKKIKYENRILYLEDEVEDYEPTFNYYDKDGEHALFEGWIGQYLNDEVEIIEEPQEHKIPEKIEYHQVRKNEVEVDYIEDGIVKHFCLNKKQRYFADKINEIIDYLEEIE